MKIIIDADACPVVDVAVGILIISTLYSCDCMGLIFGDYKSD